MVTIISGILLCKVVTSLPLFCITASIYSLVAMAIERYRAICTTAGIMNLVTAKKIMALIWVWSLLVIIPTTVEYAVFKEYYTPSTTNITEKLTSGMTTENSVALTPLGGEEGPGKINTTLTPETELPFIRVCGNTQGLVYGLINGTFLIIVAYIVPLFIIIVCYGKVGYFIIIKTKEQENAQGGKGFSVSKNKVRILKMLIMVALLFAISWCPYFVILLTSVC